MSWNSSQFILPSRLLWILVWIWHDLAWLTVGTAWLVFILWNDCRSQWGFDSRHYSEDRCQNLFLDAAAKETWEARHPCLCYQGSIVTLLTHLLVSQITGILSITFSIMPEAFSTSQWAVGWTGMKLAKQHGQLCVVHPIQQSIPCNPGLLESWALTGSNSFHTPMWALNRYHCPSLQSAKLPLPLGHW